MFRLYERRTILGFTISELLVVVVVIAIVASITVISFNGIQERAQRSAALANLNNAYSKLKVWTIDHNAILPESLEAAGVEQPKNGEIVFWPYNNNTGICLSSRVGGVTVYQLWDEGVPAKDGACDEIDWVTGPPLARNSTLDSVVAFDDYDTAAAGVTFYTVMEFFNADAHFTTLSRLGMAGSSSKIQIDTDGTGLSGSRYRMDTPLQSNIYSVQNDVRNVPGMHVMWVVIRNSNTVREFAYDKAAPHTSLSLSVGTELVFNRLTLAAANSSQRPVFTTVFAGAHDITTRTKVLDWLARKYDIPLSLYE